MGRHTGMQDAKMFCCSAWLQTACDALEDLINGKSLNCQQKEKLKWAGSLLAKADYDSPFRDKSDFSPVLATSVSPIFYRSLRDLLEFDSDYQAEFHDNSTSIASYREFSDRVHQTLDSGCEKNALSKAEIRMTAKLFHRMSEYIFSSLHSSNEYQCLAG
jgi:hypothetical protein